MRVATLAVAAAAWAALAAAAPLGAQEDTIRADPPPPPADTLVLQEALSTALHRNPDVRSARADASAEHAARWADWGAFLPDASASASFSRSRRTTFSFEQPEGTPEEREVAVTSEVHGVSQGLNFQWNLLEGGRRFAELEAGGDRARAAELQLSAAERQTVAEVKAAYYQALQAQRLRAIARRQLRSRREELERARQRFRLAAIDRSDLLGTEGQVREAELQLLEARDQARSTLRDLGVAMGTPERLDERIALGDPPPPPDASRLVADSLVGRAMEGHPELGALEARISAASADVWGERSSYLPTISLNYSTDRSERLGPEGQFFNFDPRNSSNTFSLSASWQIFTGFQRREQNARMSATRDRRRAERARRRLEIERTVRDLTAEVKRRQRRLRILERRLEVAQERLRLTEERFRRGSVPFVELQNAIQELTQAERRLVQERFAYLGAWARLERWTGDLGGGV
mgnify:CR=1 FL=1